MHHFEGARQQDLTNSEEAPTQSVARRPCSQKTSLCNAVQAVQCETVDGSDQGDQFGADGQKQKVSQQ